MKVMVIVKASQGSEAGDMPSEELFAAMGKYNEELVNAGIMLAGEGLHPSSKGVRVRFSGDKRLVTDGPFAETKELIAGYWLWRVDSMEQAIEWVKRCPNPMNEDSDIEIRQVFEADDFGETFTPELREQEAAIRAKAQGLGMPRFEDGPDMVIAGLTESYTMETRGNIPDQWRRFLAVQDKVAGQVDEDAYGVCWNTTPECAFDYLTGVRVASEEVLPAGFQSLTLASHRYAVFEHTEHVSALPETLEGIWMKWAPDCGLKLAEAPCFERYTKSYQPETGFGGIEIWIPVTI